MDSCFTLLGVVIWCSRYLSVILEVVEGCSRRYRHRWGTWRRIPSSLDDYPGASSEILKPEVGEVTGPQQCLLLGCGLKKDTITRILIAIFLLFTLLCILQRIFTKSVSGVVIFNVQNRIDFTIISLVSLASTFSLQRAPQKPTKTINYLPLRNTPIANSLSMMSSWCFVYHNFAISHWACPSLLISETLKW